MDIEHMFKPSRASIGRYAHGGIRTPQSNESGYISDGGTLPWQDPIPEERPPEIKKVSEEVKKCEKNYLELFNEE